MASVPIWIRRLDTEDVNFIKNFVLASGSIKEMAGAYGVSYPTMRARLDRLIEKIEIADDERNDSFETLVKNLALEKRIDIPTTKILLDEYRRTKDGAQERGDS